MNLVTADGEIVLIDEITPDSSRYFYTEGYRGERLRGRGTNNFQKVCASMAYK
jgi:phosphoribosylaminoimidazole-succinocarboxamide synthase